MATLVSAYGNFGLGVLPSVQGPTLSAPPKTLPVEVNTNRQVSGHTSASALEALKLMSHISSGLSLLFSASTSDASR